VEPATSARADAVERRHPGVPGPGAASSARCILTMSHSRWADVYATIAFQGGLTGRGSREFDHDPIRRGP